MARGRIISKSISHSEKLALLYEVDNGLAEFACLLFTWLIPHTDDHGQISASPLSVKMEVMTNSPRSILDVKNALSLLAVVKLIELHKTEPILRIVNFDSFQTFRGDRTKQNKYPNLKWLTKDIPTSTTDIPCHAIREVKGSEEKLKEEKKNKTKEKEGAFILPDWIDKTAWNEFILMRKKIKKPLTDYAAKLKIKKLEQLQSEGNNHVEVLNRSIESDWHDIYSLKDKDNGIGKPKHEATTLGKADLKDENETEITLDEYTAKMRLELDDNKWEPSAELKNMVDIAGKIRVAT